MSKLEVFNGKQTNWCGLWWHPETGYFSSQALSLSELRKFEGPVRLYVRKNKFFEGGKNNRPNYNFILRDAKSDNCYEMTVEDIEDTFDDGNNSNARPYCGDGVYYTEDDGRLYTGEEVRKIINGVVSDVEYGIHDPYDILPEDFL